MASINDVASVAGVSPTTVSHVISGKRKVSPERTRAVREAMERLSFTPSRAAQSLASGATRTLGLIVPDISNSFFAELAKGAEYAARDAGFNLLLANTGFNHEQERAYLEMIASRAVDGVIYAAGIPPRVQDLAEMLAGIPAVLVDERIPGLSLDVVVSDNSRGGVKIAKHLNELGHRRSLVVDAPRVPSTSAERVEGFRGAWGEFGNLLWVTSGDFSYDSGKKAIRRSADLIRDEGITCIFAVNDLMALGVLKELKRQNIKVPRQVSVVGFDGIFAGRICSPALTTVGQKAAEIGMSAVQTLIKRIDEPGRPPVSTVISVKLIRRATTMRLPEQGADSPQLLG